MNSQNRLSAKAFVKPNENTYINLFNAILKLMMLAHSLMVKNEDNIDGLNEDTLRNKLLKYMRDNRGKYELGRYNFEPETAEIDDSDITKGYLDIKAIIPTNDDLSNEKQKYYTIECKRLNGQSDKNKAYIEEGIYRFITGKYSSKMPLACMAGFVEKSKKQVEGDRIVAIVEDINNKLVADFERNDCEKLAKNPIVQDFKHSYKSKHLRDNDLGDIDISHLFLDNTATCTNS